MWMHGVVGYIEAYIAGYSNYSKLADNRNENRSTKIENIHTMEPNDPEGPRDEILVLFPLSCQSMLCIVAFRDQISYYTYLHICK